jgi:hypothetical protein
MTKNEVKKIEKNVVNCAIVRVVAPCFSNIFEGSAPRKWFVKMRKRRGSKWPKMAQNDPLRGGLPTTKKLVGDQKKSQRKNVLGASFRVFSKCFGPAIYKGVPTLHMGKMAKNGIPAMQK